MITGDYHHTAIAVAKGVGMVQPGSDIVVIDTYRRTTTTVRAIRTCNASFSGQPCGYTELHTTGFLLCPRQQGFSGQPSTAAAGRAADAVCCL